MTPFQMNPPPARDDLNATSTAKKRRLAQEGRITPLDELEQRYKPFHSMLGKVHMIGSAQRLPHGGGNPLSICSYV